MTDLVRDEKYSAKKRTLASLDAVGRVIETEYNHSNSPEFKNAMKVMRETRSLPAQDVDCAIGQRVLEGDYEGAKQLLQLPIVPWKPHIQPKRSEATTSFSASYLMSPFDRASDMLTSKALASASIRDKKNALLKAARVWAQVPDREIKDSFKNDAFEGYMDTKWLVGQLYRAGVDESELGRTLNDCFYAAQDYNEAKLKQAIRNMRVHLSYITLAKGANHD